MASSGEVAETQPAEYPSPHKRVWVPTMVVKCHNNAKSPIPSHYFGLSILCYCGNMAVQHGGLHTRGPAPYVNMKGSF